MADTSDIEGPNQRERLVEAQGAAAAGDPLGMVAALFASGFLDGLTRRIQRGWPKIDSEVVVADAVEALYEEVADGEKIHSIGAFLFKVASFKAGDEARKRERADRDARTAAELAHAEALPVEQSDRDALRARALQLARSLLPEIGTGNVLRVMSCVFEAVAERRADLPEDEIAATLGLKKSTVHVLLFRGFGRLQRLAMKRGFTIPSTRWSSGIRPVRAEGEEEKDD